MEKLPNLYNLKEEKENLEAIITDTKEGGISREIAEKALKENETEIEGSIAKHGGLSNAKEHFKKEKARAERGSIIDEEIIEKEIGPTFKKLNNLEEKRDDLRDFEIQILRSLQSDPYARKSNERLLKTIQKDKIKVESEIGDIEKKEPRAYRAGELVSYKKGLHKEGHIAPTPKVREYLDEIGRRMITGKPMFLHGPTGTGKTSLARFAAKHFTGKDAQMVYCNPQTRISHIWGKTGIKPVENNTSGAIQTVDILGPLSRAIEQGCIVIFDEFSALPKELMVSIKGIFGKKVGESVPIEGNGSIKMAEGFQMIFTANLKSDKNPERQELPPEITREFEQNNLEVTYTPKEEAYDIMLARLMNSDGSIDMSWYDMNTTLPKLCEAMEEIQIAYTDKESEDLARQTGTMNASGKRQGLKKFVMTQGTVEAILEDWKLEKQIESKPKCFVEFLDERLATGITFKEYSEADRILAAKILASKGFLRTLTPEDLSLPKNVFDFDAAKKQRANIEALAPVIKDSSKEVHISIKDLADLDPFNMRGKHIKDLANQFLNQEKSKDTFSSGMMKKMSKILGKEKVADSVISAEYIYKNPQSGKAERQENIELDIEKILFRYSDFYKEKGIDMPDDFEEQIREIWERNYDEIQKAVEENGFDDMIIAPANIPLTEISEKMKVGNGYWKSSNFTEGGEFAGAVSVGVDKPRIILVHKVKEIDEIPELAQTKGKKAQDLKVDESLSLDDYLYYQGIYFKETGKHIDEKYYTWLTKTKSGSRFVISHWAQTGDKLDVSAFDADRSYSIFGSRASRYFT